MFKYLRDKLTELETARKIRENVLEEISKSHGGHPSFETAYLYLMKIKFAWWWIGIRNISPTVIFAATLHDIWCDDNFENNYISLIDLPKLARLYKLNYDEMTGKEAYVGVGGGKCP